MQLSTTKLLPETKRLAKQQAAARGMFLYEYLDEIVRRDVTGEFSGLAKLVLDEPINARDLRPDDIKRLAIGT